jgi:hypothetical protein
LEEKSMYLPVKELLEKNGFIVKGEIGEIDVFGMNLAFSVAVELKTKISLKLLYQAVERQKIAESVYVAIPADAKKSHLDSYRHFIHLLRRLEIGLIIVNNEKAYIELESIPFDRNKSVSRNQKKKNIIVSEFTNRTNSLNIGGSKGKKVTYYRELSLRIGSFLKEGINSSPKQIKAATGIENTSSILQKNYYGWFIRLSRGCYGLSPIGKREVQEYLLKGVLDKN